ncbi:MAG: hypothetical protein KatS3mg015_2552 [Fimbriimonadales bacterium]|nr:MAG: hypothetical protein KatS3mg015_2552 [Fimbriimonadales bacterium]
MSEHSLDTWCWCGACGAAAWGVPPHGEGVACPLVLERHAAEQRRAEENHAAHLAKLDAERMYYIRGGAAFSVLGDIVGE